MTKNEAMMSSFRPQLYVNQACPFCLKLAIYLAQAGLLDQFDLIVLQPGSTEHEAAKAKLAPHFESVSFPTVETAPGVFMKESDALIAHYETQSGRPANDMPLLSYYETGVMKKYSELFVENRKLKHEASVR